jgi:hypothetical protein
MPGDHTWEVPEGALAAPCSDTDGSLVPGRTYRVQFRFGVGSPSNEVQTVNSDPFEVTS